MRHGPVDYLSICTIFALFSPLTRHLRGASDFSEGIEEYRIFQKRERGNKRNEENEENRRNYLIVGRREPIPP